MSKVSPCHVIMAAGVVVDRDRVWDVGALYEVIPIPSEPHHIPTREEAQAAKRKRLQGMLNIACTLGDEKKARRALMLMRLARERGEI